MPDVISDTNGKLCVGSYHMWRLLSNPDNYSFILFAWLQERRPVSVSLLIVCLISLFSYRKFYFLSGTTMIIPDKLLTSINFVSEILLRKLDEKLLKCLHLSPLTCTSSLPNCP